MKAVLSLAKERQVLPILNTISAKNGIAYATDLDLQIEYPLRDDIENGLYSPYEFLRQDFRHKVPIDQDEFPEFDKSGEILGTLDINVEALQFLSPAMSNQDVRYYLNGIAVFRTKMVATDGHRLNLVKLPKGHLSHSSFKTGIILPRNTIQYILLADKDQKADTVQIEFSQKCSCIKAGKYTIRTKNLDATYPNIKRVFPRPELIIGHTTFVAAEIKPILQALKLILQQKRINGPVTLVVDRGFACYDDMKWPISCYTEHAIGFNPEYLSLAASGQMSYGNPETPILISNKELGYQTVLMPRRIV